MRKGTSVDSFLSLVRAGLWSSGNLDIRIDGSTNWQEVYQLAKEQSVLGLVLAGIERYKNLLETYGTSDQGRAKTNLGISKELLLQWIGEVQMLEQQNLAMNRFIAELVEKMRSADIYALLVKGQGLAQCYEKPLWRACGDVDLLLSDTNYEKAKSFLVPKASEVESERNYGQHLGMTIEKWVVELHGFLGSGLSDRIDRQIAEVQEAVFNGGDVRSWVNGHTMVFLPGVNSDVIFIFTHFLKHFYKDGLGLRQICDWCRLLWTYRDKIDVSLLERRLRKMRIMTEWRAFGSFAVDYLGMPSDVMPLYSDDAKWKRKAENICAFILEVGNMGHNRDMSYFDKYPYIIRKVFSMRRRCGDLIRHAQIFPLDSMRFFPRIMLNGLRSAARGE